MATMRRYDEDLRSVGQALEARNIIDFELKLLADSYVIDGMVEEESSRRSKVRQWLRRLRGRSTHGPIIFQLAKVEQLSRAGRAKRSNPGQVTNFRNVSNILRTIGAYLKTNELELVEIQKRRVSVTLYYLDRAREKREELRTISSFYSLFLELCEKRSQVEPTPGRSRS
jgi:hypothetical protein